MNVLRQPSSKYKSAIGCKTNGYLKPNSRITNYAKTHNIMKYSEELYTINLSQLGVFKCYCKIKFDLKTT